MNLTGQTVYGLTLTASRLQITGSVGVAQAWITMSPYAHQKLALLPVQCTALSGHASRLLPGVLTCSLGMAGACSPGVMATSVAVWMWCRALACATAAVHVSIAPPTDHAGDAKSQRASFTTTGADLAPRWAAWVRPARASPSASLPVSGWLVRQSVRVLPGATLRPNRAKISSSSGIPTEC